MAGTANYWDKVLNRRLTRRRSLGVAAGGAAAAAFLAACGSDDGDNGGNGGGTGGSSGSGSSGGGSSGAAPTQQPGLLAAREDTSAQAVKGGTLVTTNAAEPSTFDPHLLTLPGAAAVSLIYNKLFSVKPGVLQSTDGTIESDFAEAWEYSSDHLTLTVKLRQDAGTPDEPPLNGRNLDAEDVVYTWNRWAEIGSGSIDLVNAKNPAAPVQSVEATDSHTLLFKMAHPSASLLAGLSSQLQGQMFILPREAESDYDPRSEPKGAGAYYLSEHVPSSRIVYARNPNSYDELSYPDVIETHIIQDVPTVTAQLIAGNIYHHYFPIPPESALIIKNDAPDIGLYQTDINNLGVTVFFGFKAEPAENTPFRDVRIRRAFSMAMDRDLYADVVGNISKFRSEGLEVQTGWNSALAPSDWAGWWLDPQGSDFGENAKYYQHNIEEAKKLLAAAGHTDGIDVIANYIAGAGYGPTYHDQLQPILGMAADAGFRFEEREQNYQTNWPAEFRDSRGFFEGLAFRRTPVPAEPRDGLFALYNKAGSLNYGFDPDGVGLASAEGPFNGDPTADELTSKLRVTFDNDEAVTIAHELQRYLGGQQYIHRALASATSFDVAWPAVRNFRVFNGLTWGYLWKRYWIDETQAPLSR